MTFRHGAPSAPTGVRPVDSLAGQPATEHVDPHIEGVEVRVMATAIEINPVCLGPAPDQCGSSQMRV